MKAKKLHTDECYVCIISFIHSILDSTLALALMPWPWSWPWPWGYEVMALALALVLSVLAFINITHWSMGCDIFRSVLWHCWLGDRKVIWPVKKLGVGSLVVMMWVELCTIYSSSCHHHFHHPLLQRFTWKMAIKTERESTGDRLWLSH